MKVFALATDGSNGTDCTIFTSEVELYTSLADSICNKEELESVQQFIAAGDLDGLKDYLTDEVEPPEFYTFCIDDKDIPIPSDASHQLSLTEALRELVRCIRGGDKTSGVSMDSALEDADAILEELSTGSGEAAENLP